MARNNTDRLRPVARPATYDPNNLLDALLLRMKLGSDAALCRLLDVAPPLISKARHGGAPIGSALLIRMHQVSGLPIAELQCLMGDRRTAHRMASWPKGDPRRAELLKGQAA